ncbi:hypothetical protein PPN31114_00263 [Pandoraea pneumonica]|uniref:Uncharacterized protein n=1 Tax=Pandoraea pneumonica TaxID=2508299 RepID=A0A5E4RMS4_9BURK|nr:hypothetical protein [Pandoraea pneumonica]VVD64253.1 hypothetical protein PPN31114_00263 [Pandoraea pneumonica]
MSWIDPRLWGAFILAIALACSAGYLKGRSTGIDDQRAEQAKEVQAWQENAEAAFGMYLEAKDKKEVQYRTITKTVEAAKNATPDIVDCRTGDDWMRLYRDNAAIANGTAMPAGARTAVGSDAR